MYTKKEFPDHIVKSPYAPSPQLVTMVTFSWVGNGMNYRPVSIFLALISENVRVHCFKKCILKSGGDEVSIIKYNA